MKMNSNQAEGLKQLLNFIKRMTGQEVVVTWFADHGKTVQFTVEIRLPEVPNLDR